MFFILSKILLPLINPMVWILLLLIFGFLLRHRKSGKWLRWSALMVFIVFSNTFLFSEVFMWWEGRNETDLRPHYDAVVVLGGFSNYNTRHEMVTFNENADRFTEALKLYHTGRANKILVSGGSGMLTKPEEKESLWVKGLAFDLGVKESDLLIESESRNTHENAVETEKILRMEFNGDDHFLLITSAFHMNRAEGCFAKTGLNFDYYRVGFIMDDDDYTLQTYLLPSAFTLDSWQTLFKEWVGYVVYWGKGYV